MLLTEYTIQDFGVFRGKHTLNLRTLNSPPQNKPIILFGGMNGAGKTTLLEGVKLCLYGRSFRRERLSNGAYEKYLKGRIHHHRGLSDSDGAFVALGFEHSHLGIVSNYYVKRSWKSAGPLEEQLEILQNGRPIEDLPRDQLQDFLLDLIPAGVAELFFFDGEKIQNLAEDEPGNVHLVDAFNSLVGIDLVNHLLADLRIYRQKNQYTSSTFDSQYTKLNQEIILLNSKLDGLTRKRAQKQSEMDHLNAEIEKSEHGLASEGGSYATRREELITRKTELQIQINRYEEEMRELASGLLPFAIVPSLCLALQDRLAKEEEEQQNIAAARSINQSLEDLLTKINDSSLADGLPISETLRQEFIKRIIRMTNSVLKREVPSPEFIHQVSLPDQKRLLAWIEKARREIPILVSTVGIKLESAIRQLGSVEESLGRVPPEETIGPIINHLNSLHRELGGLLKEATALDEAITQIRRQLQEVERNLNRIQEAEMLADSEQRSSDLGLKAQTILGEFVSKLRNEKIQNVSEIFAEVFNDLSTKKNRLDKARINPADFSITLFRTNGTTITRDELSAGEKQIYAVAMLLALARVSGRPLPFIIDTPLARLDTEHRTNIVSNFFPKIGHQVIIFSTNTEIDKRYFDLLTPSISRSYLLTYDQAEESSEIRESYFWKGEMEAIEG